MLSTSHGYCLAERGKAFRCRTIRATWQGEQQGTMPRAYALFSQHGGDVQPVMATHRADVSRPRAMAALHRLAQEISIRGIRIT